MGIVYKAQDLRLNRPVALKFIPPSRKQSSIGQRRLIQEAQAASALNHPNILTIHDIGEHLGKNYIVMEFVDGESLEDRIDRGRPGEREILKTACQIAEGLQIAHRSGIIHRDIKPANIMVNRAGHVKIMDFGLAKVVDNSLLTSEGVVLGTTAYMSPEQARGEVVDARTDLWSLGVVLYEMVTENRPFTGVYMPALVYALINLDPPPIDSGSLNVSEDLVELIFRCLEKDSEDRYQSADDLLKDLELIRAGELLSGRSGPTRRVRNRNHEQAAVKVSKKPVAHLARSPYFRVGVAIVILIVALGLLKSALSKSALPPPIYPLVGLLPIEHTIVEPDEAALAFGLRTYIIDQYGEISAHHDRYSILSSEEVEKIVERDGPLLDNLDNVMLVRASIDQFENIIQLRFDRIGATVEDNTSRETIEGVADNLLEFQTDGPNSFARVLDTNRTRAEINHVVSSTTKNPEAFRSYLIGLGLLAQAKNEDQLLITENHFQRASQFDPEYGLALEGLARVHWALYVDSGKSIYRQHAENYAVQAVGKNPRLVSAHIILGNISLKANSPGVAAVEFSKALSLRPNDPRIHTLRGLAYESRNRIGQAEESYVHAIGLRPDVAEYHTRLGLMYRSSGNAEAAIIEFQNGLLADPMNASLLRELAGVYLDMGLPSVAIGVLEAVEPQSLTADVMRDIGEIKMLDLNDIDGAVNSLQVATNLNETDYRNWYLLASAIQYSTTYKHRAESTWNTTERLLKTVLKINPRNEHARTILGITAAHRGNQDEAVAIRESFVATNVTDSKTLLAAARLFELTGERDACLTIITRFLDLGGTPRHIKHAPWFSAILSDPRLSLNEKDARRAEIGE